MLLATLAVLAPGLLVGLWLLFKGPVSEPHSHLISADSLRKKLPQDLTEWRAHGRYVTSWNYLRKFLASHGYNLWPFDPVRPRTLSPPGWDYGAPNGFLHFPSTLLSAPETNVDYSQGVQLGLGGITVPRNIIWPARHDHGDVVVRVLSVGGEGQRSLKILRQVATAPESLMRSNHSLPLFREIMLQDIVLGIFPRVTASLAEIFTPNALSFMAERDVLEILMQCLEAVDFLHQNLIAHLNVTFDNFLIDFPPLLQPNLTRPPTGQCRVYITHFDHAVSFPASLPTSEQLCYGEPFFLKIKGKEGLRAKLKAPEIVDLRPFSPYPVDCWQFASGILRLESECVGFSFSMNETFPKLVSMMAGDDPTCRPSALEALTTLQNVL